jgi:hypothetical protein
MAKERRRYIIQTKANGRFFFDSSDDHNNKK